VSVLNPINNGIFLFTETHYVLLKKFVRSTFRHCKNEYALSYQ